MLWRRGCHVAKSVRGRKAANPPTGFGPACKSGFAERVPVWGAFRLATVEAGSVTGRAIACNSFDSAANKQRIHRLPVAASGSTRLGHPAKHGSVKSSTMKGPIVRKGLPVSVLRDVAENTVWSRNRLRTAAKSVGRRVRGSFCILTPEMANTAFCRFVETMAWREPAHTTDSPRDNTL
jgi:hypothetical protein